MGNKVKRRIKQAGHDTHKLVQILFEEIGRQRSSAMQIEKITNGKVKENTILQWRGRGAEPNVRSLAMAFDALGYTLTIIKRETTEKDLI